MAIVTSILTGGSNNHETTSQEANALATDFVNEGIVGDITNTNGVAPATGGFAVNAQGSPNMTVAVSAGAAYVQATPTSQSSQMLRATNSATANVNISSNSSGSTKYDWLYISISASAAANPNTAADDVATLVTSRSSSASADDGSPPTYGYPLAVITVANGAATITNANIRDIRNQIVLETGLSTDASGWNNLGFTPDTVAYSGNRSYDLTFNSTDLTDTLSPGMRLRATRTVTAPTQCTDLESGSSQYWSRASASLTGITFTDDFVTGGWVKLESYTAGVVIGRFNGTSGWRLLINSAGQVELDGFNGSGSNFSLVQSYQSLPLNKWVHIAAQLDMSAFTATTTTSYVMIDGVNVPAAVSRGGTNPTALIQAGNLEVGANNSGSNPFDGKLAQVFVSSAKITQANIRTLVGQGLTASLVSTHSIASAYSFDGNANDLNTSSANNLTAQNSAVATNADSPFSLGADLASGYTDGTTEFGVITAASFSTNTTITVQVPEGGALPTSGGVSAVDYSSQKAPYGFLADSGRWRISCPLRNQQNTTSNATFAAVTNMSFSVPTGAWEVGWKAGLFNGTTTEVYWNLSDVSQVGLSSSTSDRSLQVGTVSPSAASTITYANVSKPARLTTATTYQMYTVGATASAGMIAHVATSELFAEFTYV